MQDRIINYLVDKYEAKGVVLYGSRALMTAVEKSDFDIYIFSDKPKSEIEGFGEVDLFQGVQIDLSVYPTNVSEDFILKTSTHPIFGAVVLLDELDGKIKKIVQNSDQAYEKGPEPLTKIQKSVQRKILRKYINKACARPLDLATVYFGVSQFFYSVVETWFLVKNLWPQSLYQALPIIEKEDEKFFQALEKLYKLEYSNIEKLLAMKELYSLIVEYQEEKEV